MKISGEFTIRDIAGETVVVPIGETVLKSNVLIVLNETGKAFWSILSEDRDEEEIIRLICEDYDIDYETVKADLSSFIKYLNDNGVEVK